MFSFEFWIMASDSTYSERARVVVNIVDENDNEPNVFVAFNTPHNNIPRAGTDIQDGVEEILSLVKNE